MLERTKIQLEKSSWNISHQSGILSIGSCFSSHLAAHLQKLQFKITDNPYGILYNPISIFRSLSYNPESFGNSFIERDGLWVSFLAHSDIHSHNNKSLYEKLSGTANSVKDDLSKIEYLILTLGSAKVYEHDSFKDIVSNCHKVAQKEFKSRLLNPDEIIDEFEQLYTYISEVNSDIKIILTVSPVRYLSDGFSSNSLSKAILLLASHEIARKYDNVRYFPSYEIIMDDLRDYRYYESDLLHPNSEAVKYVMGKFEEMFFNRETSELNKRIEKILKSIQHRPFNPDSENYKSLLSKTEKEIKELPEFIDKSHLIEKLMNKESI